MHFDVEEIKKFTPEYFAKLAPLERVDVAFKLSQDLAELLDQLDKNGFRLQNHRISDDSPKANEKRGREKISQGTFSAPPQIRRDF